MEKIYFILYALAAISFAVTAVSWRWAEPWPVRRLAVLAAGLFCWVLVPLIQTAKHM